MCTQRDGLRGAAKLCSGSTFTECPRRFRARGGSSPRALRQQDRRAGCRSGRFAERLRCPACGLAHSDAHGSRPVLTAPSCAAMRCSGCWIPAGSPETGMTVGGCGACGEGRHGPSASRRPSGRTAHQPFTARGEPHERRPALAADREGGDGDVLRVAYVDGLFDDRDTYAVVTPGAAVAGPEPDEFRSAAAHRSPRSRSGRVRRTSVRLSEGHGSRPQPRPDPAVRPRLRPRPSPAPGKLRRTLRSVPESSNARHLPAAPAAAAVPEGLNAPDRAWPAVPNPPTSATDRPPLPVETGDSVRAHAARQRDGEGSDVWLDGCAEV